MKQILAVAAASAAFFVAPVLGAQRLQGQKQATAKVTKIRLLPFSAYLCFPL